MDANDGLKDATIAVLRAKLVKAEDALRVAREACVANLQMFVVKDEPVLLKAVKAIDAALASEPVTDEPPCRFGNDCDDRVWGCTESDKNPGTKCPHLGTECPQCPNHYHKPGMLFEVKS